MQDNEIQLYYAFILLSYIINFHIPCLTTLLEQHDRCH